MQVFRAIFLLCLFSISLLFANSQALASTQIISFKGYLGKDELAKAKPIFSEIAKSQNDTLIIEINSNSGDLNQVLTLAKTLYSLKAQNKVKIVIYIDDIATGPAAIIPFLADELYISPFVTWGDIPLGTENSIPTNILRNQVTSLIDSSNPHAEILNLLASGMTDKTLEIVDDNGWKIFKGGKDQHHSIVSGAGETLVVNQHQLQQLKIVTGVISLDAFRTQFKIPQAQQDILKQAAVPSAVLVSGFKNVEEQLKEHIKFNAEGQNTIGHIIIDDRTVGINQSTWLYVKNALEKYKEIKPAFVILELNTPGGEVYASQKISDALKELDTQYNIPVVCYINNWAISAGAMLAYSCRFITVVKDGAMGAAEPVIQGEGTELKAASEKVNSALRADFANRARFFDRNPNIAEAMVDKDIILVFRNGEVIKLDSESQIRSTGPNPDVVISPKGKLLTLNADQLIKYGVADILLPPEKTGIVTEAEREAGKWPANKMLLFQYPFFKQIPNATVVSLGQDWKTKFFAFLATPIVSSLLMLGVMLGFYVEISTPGFGIPGTVGLACLILLILSSFALEIANTLEIVLLFVGIAILLVDLFVLPTFGLLGIVGTIFFLGGLFGMLLPGIGNVEYEYDTKTFNAAGEVFVQRLAWFCGTIIIGSAIIAVLARFLTPKLALYSRLILAGNEQDASKGYIAGDMPDTLPQPGAQGEVLATLRPAGKVMINDKIYDAISPGGFIEKGQKIEVARLDGSVIVVNTIADNSK